MPVWTDLVEPVAAGVTDAVGTALGQLGQLGQLGDLGDDRAARGDARPGRPDAAPHARLDVLDAARPGHRHARRRGAHRLRGVAAARPRSDRRADAGRRARVRRRASRSTSRRPGSTSPCARSPGCGCSVPCRGSPRPCSPRCATTRPTSASTPAASRRRSARSTPPTPRPCSRRCRAGCSRPQPSPAQQAALARLETLLALVEGWVDVVADRATREHLPQADALGEAVRRRRATGGPAEKAFGALVGLELRPRRLRDAANLFAALEDSGGPGARDGAWRHPDLAPSTADLDDPLGYVERTATPETDEMDAALDAPAARRGRRVSGCRPGSADAVRARRRPGRGDGIRAPARRRGVGADSAGRRRTPGRSGLRRDYLDHLAAHPDGVAKAGPPAHLTASCVVLDAGRRAGAAHPAPQGRRSGSSSAGTSRPATPRCGRPARREAREESGHRHARAAAAARCSSTGTCWSASSAPAASTSTCGTPRWRRPGRRAASARSRTTCGGGRSTPCRAGTRAELAPLVSLARRALGLG